MCPVTELSVVCSKVVPSSEVEFMDNISAGGEQFVHCSEVVHSAQR